MPYDYLKRLSGGKHEELLRKGYVCTEEPVLGLNPDEAKIFDEKCDHDYDQDDGHESLGLGDDFSPF